MDARKERFDRQAAWDKLKAAKNVVVAKGKKVIELEPSEANREAILKAAMGPSGNLRAPAIKKEDLFVVGFHEEVYAQRL